MAALIQSRGMKAVTDRFWRSRFSTRLLAASSASVLVAIVATVPLAVNAKDTKLPNNPVGAWDGKVKSAAPGTEAKTLSPEQLISIDKVNGYFNKVSKLKGTFAQTNPDQKVQRGKFYLMRPGRFRFDYNRPSRQIIVSDGKLLAIQDLDLNNEETYSLENTPFRILLRDNVHLLRDAQILAVEQSETQTAVTLTDKSADSPGQITIYLTGGGEPTLAGWVTTDVQGGVTKVEVSELEKPANMDAKLFQREKLFMKSIQ